MNDRKETLQGRVAAIVNARELVINIGSNHGVILGMKFAIMAATPLEIKDPSTGKVLDRLDREKVRVEATEVREFITICRTYRVKHIPAGTASFSDISTWLREPRDVPETLSVRDSSLPPPLPEEESYVKVNDRAIQVMGK